MISLQPCGVYITLSLFLCLEVRHFLNCLYFCRSNPTRSLKDVTKATTVIYHCIFTNSFIISLLYNDSSSHIVLAEYFLFSERSKQFDLRASMRCGLLLGGSLVCRVASVLQPFLLLSGIALLPLLHGFFISSTTRRHNPKRHRDARMDCAPLAC